MPTKKNYSISAISFADNNGHRYISHVIMHECDDNTVHVGTKYTRTQVLQKLDEGHYIDTIRWSYLNANWQTGAKVEPYTRNGTRYLRTVPDASVSDNLDNLLPLDNLGL